MSNSRESSIPMHACKKMKTQNNVWREINTQARMDPGNTNENVDAESQNKGERISLDTNKKEVVMLNASRKIFESSNKIESLDDKAKGNIISNAQLNPQPVESFVSAKHDKPELKVKYVREIPVETLMVNKKTVSTDNESGEKNGPRTISLMKDAENISNTEIHERAVEVGSLERFIKAGHVQRRIERETGVKLKFVSIEEETYVVLNGASTLSVRAASEMIQEILLEAIDSRFVDYSHFISLPLAHHSELIEKLHEFQRSILGECASSSNEEDDSDNTSDTASSGDDQSAYSKGSGIEKSMFIKPATFHLTVLMLKLWKKDLVSTAVEVLHKVSPQVNSVLEGRPVAINLRGLELMRGSPAKAHVLYARVNEVGGGERLQIACQTIIEAFKDAGLVLEKDASSRLKLHATLMNSRHRRRRGKKVKKDNSFDARPVIKQYGSKDWGEYVISGAHLSQRFCYDGNGYYQCCASIPFPQNSVDNNKASDTV
eukprot:TRINITY_DN426_c0_g1_i4.p1 TRINITY_DN426_c0_g1~~TRINITY_DN426_c0_g1_i4.p1  ORF type:complete len:489 (-),score=124.25 TRINITY_DN426_c0_g1_i4:391-1857(-)